MSVRKRFLARVGSSPVSETAQLLQFIIWTLPLVLAFALFEIMSFALFRENATALTGAVLAAYAGALVAARHLALNGNTSYAVHAICVGYLVATLLIIPLQPDLTMALAVTPFLAVGVALPHTRDRTLRYLMVLAWVVGVSAVSYVHLVAPGSDSYWYEIALPIAAFGATAAVALLLLWQFRSKLMNTLMRVREAEQRYALAERGTNDGLWDWDLLNDSFYLSPRWREMVGHCEHQVKNSSKEWLGRVHPEDRAAFEAEIEGSLGGTGDSLQCEHRILHEDGRTLWVLNRGLIVRDKDGRAVRVVGAQTDITRRKHVEEQLLYQAKHDNLTGLPNRVALEERLSASIERTRNDEGYLFCVLFLDLDRFKNVNDSLGHSIGDDMLIATAKRLEACVRPTDTVSRLGGDEFVILLDGLNDDADATWLARKIQQAISRPLDLDGHELFMTASIGIVHQPDGYERPEDLLRDADIAMYTAKDLGRARHEVFEVDMHSKIVSRLTLETDLRRAVEKEEFLVYYQPIVSLSTGRIVAFEALLRWKHPERGMVSPAEFIPLAEETGLIVPIGLQVLRESCLQMHDWQKRFPELVPLTIDVNLSNVQLNQQDILNQLAATLYETGLDGSKLRLEITESALAQNEESAISTLSQIRGLGVHTHIDDFGTGYSSLGALHRFPLTGLKIDRSFISRMEDNGDDTEIVHTITSLAHNLGMDVIAEGVEIPAQLARLRSMNCDYAQGYLFSEPVCGEDAGKLLTASPRW